MNRELIIFISVFIRAIKDRIRVGQYFIDNDGLRTGAVTRVKFESYLKTQGFKLSLPEVATDCSFGCVS